MSAVYRAAVKALSENPDLLAKVTSAGSAEERQAHLRSAGIEVPTHADVNSHMSNVAGGLSSSELWGYAGDGVDAYEAYEEAAAASSGAAAGAAAA